MKQELIHKLEKIVNNQNLDENELLFQLKKVLHETEVKNSNIKETVSIATMVSENLRVLYNGKQNSPNILTGFASLDILFNGFTYGEFVVIAGRLGMGKTQMLINLALNISKTIPILYFTFDVSKFILTHRFIASYSKIPFGKLLFLNISEVEKIVLLAMEDMLSERKIFINDSSYNSASDFIEHCKKLIVETGAKVIIVDSLQMLSLNKDHKSRQLEISIISYALKNLAKEHNVCVLAASKLTKAGFPRGRETQPYLTDLVMENEAIVHNADKVLLINRPEYFGIDVDDNGHRTALSVEVILAKDNRGDIGTAKLIRDPYFTNFFEIGEHL
jgi:replicative DNA helicase